MASEQGTGDDWTARRFGAAVTAAVIAALVWFVAWQAWPAHEGGARSLSSGLPKTFTPRLPGRAAATQFLAFEPNVGQAAKNVRFVSGGPSHRIEVFDDGMSLSAPRGAQPAASAQLRFVGANRGTFETREAASGHSNYLIGADPSRWLRDVPRWRQLRMAELYPGIDLVYYSRDGQLEFDLVARPGSDPSRIRLSLAGAAEPSLAANGDLLLDGPQGTLRLHAPVLYQNIDGEKRTLIGRFALDAEHRELRFDLPAYDTRYPLVIDPVFKTLYSTYLGGVHDDVVGGLVLDADHNVYVIGQSGSEDWPVSANAFQSTRKALGQYVRNVVVTKFDAAGVLLYSTFIGGSINDYGTAIAVDATGHAYLTGYTQSTDFPTTAGALQTTRQGAQSAFLAVLSQDGSALQYATLFGSNSSTRGIAFDPSGNVVIAGSAGPGLTTTTGAYKTTLADGAAGFIAKFALPAAGPATLLASTYYGVDAPEANSVGTGNAIQGLALDANGAPWFSGQAYTIHLPTTGNQLMSPPTAIDPSCRSGVAANNSFAYIGHLSADLKTLTYASYLSGKTREPGVCSEWAWDLAVDAAGDLYVGGTTASAVFPTTTGSAQPAYPGNSGFNGFVGWVAKLKGDGSAILWSTYLGGDGGRTYLERILLDNKGALWVSTATGGGTNFPITSGALQTAYGGGTFDGSIGKLDAATGALLYSSYYGGAGDDYSAGLAVDASGTAYLAGMTASRDFPVTANAIQPQYTADSFDGSDWFFSILGSGAVSQVLPARGGNAGDVTLRIAGVGFKSGATCALAGSGTTLAGSNAQLSEDGTTMYCTFALTGAQPGSYDLAVINPDATRIERSAAFTVQADSLGSDMQVEVVGRSTVRAGTPSTFDVVVTNTGSADAIGVYLFVRFSKGFAPVDPSLGDPFGLSLLPAVAIDPKDTNDYSHPKIVLPSSIGTGESVVPLFLPFVAAGASVDFALPLLAADESDDEYVEAFVYDGIADSEAQLAQYTGMKSLSALPGGRAMALALTGHPVQAERARAQGLSADCTQAIWDAIWKEINSKIPPIDCFNNLQREVFELKRLQYTHPANRAAFTGDVAKSTFQAVTGCAELAGIEIAAPVEAMKKFLDLMEHKDELEKISDKCKDKDKDKDKNKGKKSKKSSKAKKAKDPNEKIGPSGDGSAAHFIGNLPRFTYQVAFENKADAGLPASTVVVTDTLDPAKFDLSTLSLGNIAWGSVRVDVPPGLSSYATTVPIDTTMSVRVQGSLNAATGVLKWTFTTIDPATGLAPSDPTIGFLPPDTDGVRGQGSVNFTLAPKTGFPEGTTWTNQASIVFDTNPPIATAVWTNTLDTVAPVSHAAAASARSTATSFGVSWSGTDAGAGVRSYNVYVSDNGGDYQPWLVATAATSGTYDGATGHTYAFHSIATDGVGNTEPDKSAAEATVVVDTNATVTPTAGSSGGGGGCTVGRDDQRDVALPAMLLAAIGVLVRRRRVAAGPVALR